MVDFIEKYCFSEIYSFNNESLKNLPFNKGLQTKVSTFLPKFCEVSKVNKINFLLNSLHFFRRVVLESEFVYKISEVDVKVGRAEKESLLFRFLIKFSLFFQKLYDNLFKTIQTPRSSKVVLEDDQPTEVKTPSEEEVILHPIEVIDPPQENKVENHEEIILQETESRKVVSEQHSLKELLKARRKNLNKLEIKKKKSLQPPLVRRVKDYIESRRRGLSDQNEDAVSGEEW